MPIGIGGDRSRGVDSSDTALAGDIEGDRVAGIIDDEAVTVAVAVLRYDAEVVRRSRVVFHPRFQRERRSGQVERYVAWSFLGQELVKGGR